MSADEPYLVWMANKRWQDHGFDQRITKEMERHARILWVDPPVSLATSAQRRFGAARTVRPVLTQLSERVTRLTPTAVPGMTRFGVRATTAPLIRAQVRWALRRLDIEPFAVVSTALHDVQGRWGAGVVSALHGTDDFVAGAELMGVSVRWLRAQERKAVAHADVVTALSPLLAERWSVLRGAPVPLIPNGCTPVAACPQPPPPHVLSELRRPVVGLVGRLNARIDIELVAAIADAGYSLLIVGPHHSHWEQARFAALTARPGVHYVGRVPEAAAPGYIAAADVGITPYLDTPFNRASFPLKTLDYLSAGLPVGQYRPPRYPVAPRRSRGQRAGDCSWSDPGPGHGTRRFRPGGAAHSRRPGPGRPGQCRVRRQRNNPGAAVPRLRRAALLGLPRRRSGGRHRPHGRSWYDTDRAGRVDDAGLRAGLRRVPSGWRPGPDSSPGR